MKKRVLLAASRRATLAKKKYAQNMSAHEVEAKIRVRIRTAIDQLMAARGGTP